MDRGKGREGTEEDVGEGGEEIEDLEETRRFDTTIHAASVLGQKLNASVGSFMSRILPETTVSSILPTNIYIYTGYI